MSIPKPLQLFSYSALILLASSACTHDATDDEYERAGELEENYDPPVQNNYFIVTRVDPTECLAPACGGWFVKWLDEDLTPCADGSWQAECHMFALDLSQLDLTTKVKTALAAGFGDRSVLVKGQLVERPTKSGLADTLVASETLAQTTALVGPAGGHLEVQQGPLTGLAIDIPPGAVDEPTQFSVQARDRLEPGELEATVGPAAELEPHGVEFHEPVSVTMPLTGALEPENPVLMLSERESGRRIALPDDPTNQLEGQIRVRVGEFSIFQPIQRNIDQMVANAEAQATCENLAQLEGLADPWSEHLYYYEGVSVSATFFGLQELGGVDAVYDLYNSQIGSFWYVGLGLYTGLLGGAGTAYAGWGSGERDSVQDAWSGNVVGASFDLDLVAAFTGFLGLSAGAASFVTCADLSALPNIPNNRWCYPEEVQAPWVDAVFGFGGTVSIGINAIPEIALGAVNIGATNGWWNSWPLYNWLLSQVVGFGGVSHSLVEFPVSFPATGDTASYLQIESPDGTELGRGREMARAILLTAAAPEPAFHAAEYAILVGLARDNAQTLAEYCGSRCVSGQLHYVSSNNCISGPASGTAELYRVVDNDFVLEGEIEIGNDGSFCVDMSGDEVYRIVQRDQDGGNCWPGYLVECNYWIEAGVGDGGGFCSVDSCEDHGVIAFDCGS